MPLCPFGPTMCAPPGGLGGLSYGWHDSAGVVMGQDGVQQSDSMTALGGSPGSRFSLFPPPSTAFCSPAKVPSLDSPSPLPWVLEQGRASSSFLPSFLGTETKLGGGDARQGRGLSNHPAIQNESVPTTSPPIPRDPGSQWEVDKWGDSLIWSKSSATPGWPPPASHP